MKKFAIILAVAFMPIMAQAQVGETIDRIINAFMSDDDDDDTQTLSVETLTRFEGEKITGVQASNAFEVLLVRSNATKAVVTIDSELERYLEVSRDASGVVSVGLDDLPKKFNRGDRTMRLVLYLPQLNTVRLSGASELKATEEFPGENVDIMLSGASEIDERLVIAGKRVKAQCSGASELSLGLPATDELIVVASGSSDMDIHATALKTSKFGVSGASEVEVSGSGESSDWTVSGSSEADAMEFMVKNVTIKASGASSVAVSAVDRLSVGASGASSVRYRGNPEVRKNTSGASSLRRVN